MEPKGNENGFVIGSMWWTIARNKDWVNETKINCPWIWLFRWMRGFFFPYNWKVRTKKSDPVLALDQQFSDDCKDIPRLFSSPCWAALGWHSFLRAGSYNSCWVTSGSSCPESEKINQLFLCCFLKCRKLPRGLWRPGMATCPVSQNLIIDRHNGVMGFIHNPPNT